MKKMKRITRRLRGFRHYRAFVLSITAIMVGLFVASFVDSRSEGFVTSTPSLTLRFTGLANEQSMLDFCYQLQTIQGITGVTYREYSPGTQSALITVFYNPHVASERQIKVFLQNSTVVWGETRST
ncbi:MAG: hypothetical protein ABIQ57_02060 [Candidatus Kapaibacterium sp.]